MRHQWPPDLSRPAAGRLALIQPWEFGSLPRDWQAGLRDDVDEVWVPSAFTREMYLEAGVEADRVHVVPNGVDLGTLDARAARAPSCPTRRCACCSSAARSRARGPTCLLSAFDEAFAGRDDVLLVIKDIGGQSYYRGMTMARRPARTRRVGRAATRALRRGRADAG